MNSYQFNTQLSMIIYPIEFFILISLCIVYIFLFINDKKSKIHIIILISLILSMIYCVLSYIFIDGNITYEYFYINLINGFIVFERTCIYICNAYKLNISFGGSIFEIKKYVFAFIYSILAVICCGYFILVTLIRDDQTTFRIILITFVVMDIFCAVISVLIFAVKINKLLAIQMVPEMKFIVNKLTVLTMICTLSSVIFILIPGLLLPEYIKPSKLFCIDLVINNACLLLSFGNASNLYRKVCCCFNCKNMGSTLVRIRSVAVTGMSPRNVSPTTTTSPNLETTNNDNANNIEQENPKKEGNESIPATIKENITPKAITDHIITIDLKTDIPKTQTTLASKYKSDSLKLPQTLHNKHSNSLQLPHKGISNSLGLPHKHYSNSLNVPGLSSFDSLSVSQQIITDTTTKFDVLVPMTTVTETTAIDFDSNGQRIRRDSIDHFVSTMVEIQEPTGFEGNEMDTTNNTQKTIKTPIVTPYDVSNNGDIDWNQLSIISDNNDDDTYETLKRNTPSTCVKQMKELGIIM